jgi:hypothetical protein
MNAAASTLIARERSDDCRVRTVLSMMLTPRSWVAFEFYKTLCILDQHPAVRRDWPIAACVATLWEIRQALASLPDSRTPTARDWARLSSYWRGDLNARIAYLERLRDSLTGCIGCGCLSMKNCPIFNEDDKLAGEGHGPVLLDRVGGLKSPAAQVSDHPR